MTVPAGALATRRANRLIADVHTAVLRVWILIRKISEGYWGAVGVPIAFGGLQDVSFAQRDQAGANDSAECSPEPLYHAELVTERALR